MKWLMCGHGCSSARAGTPRLPDPLALPVRRTSRTAYARGLPLSLFSIAPLLPNTVDKDWKFRDGVYQTGGTDAAPAGSV